MSFKEKRLSASFTYDQFETDISPNNSPKSGRSRIIGFSSPLSTIRNSKSPGKSSKHPESNPMSRTDRQESEESETIILGDNTDNIPYLAHTDPKMKTSHRSTVSTKRDSVEIPAEYKVIHREASLQLAMNANKSILKGVDLFKKISRDVLDSTVFKHLVTFFTLWALFGNSIRIAYMASSVDFFFEVVISVVFFFFVYEIIAKLLCDVKYFPPLPSWNINKNENYFGKFYRLCRVGSFYFWIDVISTSSLVLEIRWIVGSQFISDVANSRRAAAVSTASLATRIVRLVRIIRLVRLFRLASELVGNFSCFGLLEREKKKKSINPESKVGAAMAELTNRRATLFVIVIFVIIPLLSYTRSDYTNETAARFIHSLSIYNQSDPSTYESILSLAINNAFVKTKIVSMQLSNGFYYRDDITLEELRIEDISNYHYNSNGVTTDIDFDRSAAAISSAKSEIYSILFVLGMLVLIIFFFTREVDRLVIIPIEKMVDLVKTISGNPLGANYKLDENDGFVEGLETTILLTTITKIVGLMRVGFGEAGAGVIARNLADSESGKLEFTGAGVRIDSIFGFCDVRQFTDTTECLQEEVMLFVNRIAHILHGIVVQCDGVANKNIGDAFLLTWKLDKSSPPNKPNVLADKALIAFCRSLIELSKHQGFICDFSPEAKNNLKLKFPDYKVRIGCGLHVGWAIEGAIGSYRKIDASYLSPNVSFTEFLESSTKKYGLSLLLSEPFYRKLSHEAAACCRQVDLIKPSRDAEPLGLYTYDVDPDIDWSEFDRIKKFRSKQIPLSQKSVNKRLSRGKRLSISEIRRQKTMEIAAASNVVEKSPKKPHSRAHELNRLKHESFERSLDQGYRPDHDDDVEKAFSLIHKGKHETKEAPTITLEKYSRILWNNDDELIKLRAQLDKVHRSYYDKGFECYLKGDWRTATDMFEKVLIKTKGKDGPSKNLMSIIQSPKFNGNPPEGWKGYIFDDDDDDDD